MLLIRYVFRNMARRLTSTVMTLVGIAMVVVVFTLIFAISAGLEGVLSRTGHPRGLLVLRRGSEAETLSALTRENALLLRSLPGIESDGGETLASVERIVLVNLERQNGMESNVVVRGVTPVAFALRENLRIVEGRALTPGVAEVIVSRRISERFRGARPGGVLEFGARQWPVVGIFEAGETAADSEIWTDSEVLGAAFQRTDIVSSVLLRATDDAAAAALTQQVEEDKRLQLKVVPEREYWAMQTRDTVGRILMPGIIISLLMGLGAASGAMNTLYAAVANRTREIGTLRALGFSRRAVLLAFLCEAALLSLVGGILGLVPAFFFNGMETGTTNFQTFSELTFSFTVTPGIVVYSLLFALFMGVVGGLLPAIRAARMPITSALRAA